MTEYRIVKVKDIGRVVTGNTPPTIKREYYADNYLFIKPTDMVVGERFVFETEEYYSEIGYKKYSKALIPPLSTCVVTIGSLGKKLCLTHKPCFTNQAVNSVIPYNGYDNYFVYYLFKYINPAIQNLSNGTASGRENVSKSSFENLNVIVPKDKTYQERIGSILSAYDDLIEINNERIILLEQNAREIYKEWFVRKRFPDFKKAKFKKGVPDGWQEKNISAIVKFLSGYSFKSSFYTANGKFGIVTIKNVQDGQFVYECSDYIDVLPNKLKDYCILKTGDVLMSLTGNVGRVCHVVGDNILLNQRVAKLKPIITDKTHFIYCFFRENSMIQFMENISLGSTAQMNLSPIQLGKQKFIVPDASLIKRFEEIVDPIFQNKYQLIELNDVLRQTRDKLLNRLMSGKLQV